MPSTPYEARCLTKSIELDPNGNPVLDTNAEFHHIDICNWRGEPRGSWGEAAADAQLHREETVTYLGPTTIARHVVWP